MKKAIIGILFMLTGAIIIIFSLYKSMQFKPLSDNTPIAVQSIKGIESIYINDFKGNIYIEKSDRNEISYSENVKVEIVDYNLNITTANYKNKENNIKILYKDNLNFVIQNSIGNLYAHVKKSSQFIIEDFVGNINLKTPKTLDFYTNDLVGISKKSNIIIDLESDTKVYVADLVGFLVVERDNKLE